MLFWVWALVIKKREAVFSLRDTKKDLVLYNIKKRGKSNGGKYKIL